MFRRMLPVLGALLLAPALASAATAPTWTNVKLPGTSKRVTEPRVIVGPDDRRWVVTNLNATSATSGNDTFGAAVVFVSRDGGQTWQRTAADPPQKSATIDTDIVAMHPVTAGGQPRIFSSELDDGGLNFPSGFTDDGGKTWTEAKGSTELADQDRQWFAVGPDDPATHMPTVYLLYHNLGSGFAQHNMWVAKSTDGGATFGPPVPVALPGSDAYADLQCADSGGPSDIAVNQRTGRIYAFFTTRGAPQSGGVDFGGCAAQPLEFNIVNATRVWVATSPDGSPGSWSDHLAVDNAKSGQVVSMQLAYGALDNAGNVYIAYPEAPQPYPHLAGAAVKLVTQQTDGTKDLADDKWSKPKTLVQPNTGGSLLVHMVAGDPGKIDVAFFKGKDIGAKDPVSNTPGTAWYLHVVQAFDALSDDVHPLEYEVSPVAAYTWSAENMMGLCSDPSDPTGGVQNGVNCDRSTDVWGVALDGQCRLTVTWPVTKPHNSANPDDAGTWVSTQTGGDALCGASTGPPTATTTPVPAGCHDKRAPSTRVQGVRAGRRSLRVHGIARDLGCSGGMRVVRVAVARKVRHRRCRFVRGNGTLGPPAACTPQRFLVAVGTKTWSLTVKGRFAKGRYVVWSRAIDKAGNRERRGAHDHHTFSVH